MSIKYRPIPTHLNYFLCIEDDLIDLSRCIEFCYSNKTVFSLELARLLMVAAAEAEVVAKELCKRIKPGSKASGINGYQSELMQAYPMLPSASVELPRFSMLFTPWSSWSTVNTSPDWWKAYSGVKHHRAQKFKEANLKNTLDATAGLLILLTMFYGIEGNYLYPAPKIFLPRSFSAPEGEALRLIKPDGVNLPSA